MTFQKLNARKSIIARVGMRLSQGPGLRLISNKCRILLCSAALLLYDSPKRSTFRVFQETQDSDHFPGWAIGGVKLHSLVLDHPTQENGRNPAFEGRYV